MADDIGCTFSEQAAARIAATVRRVEAGAPVLTRGESGAALRSPQSRFAARITGTSGTGYSWARVIQNADGTHTDFDPAQTGTGTAFEINGGTAKVGDIVELVYAGRKTDGTTAGYWFAKGGALPAPAAQFQVLQCTAYTAGTPPTYTLAFDWVRAH